MKTLIISSGFHPVTNNMGGAIENLIETYLVANDEQFKNDITLYSVRESKNMQKETNYLKYTNLRIIDKTTITYKIKQLMNAVFQKITRKYNGNVYIKEVLKDLRNRGELENTYDCIIIENIGKFVPIIKKNTDSKIVLHLHNDYLNVNTKDAKDIVEACDNIWCVSNFIVDRVKEIIENDKEKVKLLYNGINFEKIKKEVTEEEKKGIKEKYGLSEEEKVILYTGRLIPEKGVKHLLQAFKKLSENRKDVVLIIAGGTRQINTNKDYFVKELMDIAKKINNKVIFTGKIEYDRLYEVYSIADVQVVPSIWEEAFGLIIIEGMLYSIPLITTNSGGIPEIVKDDTAIILDKQNNLVENLYKSLIYFCEKPQSMKEKTKKYPEILKNFTKEMYNNSFNTLMNRLVEME